MGFGLRMSAFLKTKTVRFAALGLALSGWALWACSLNSETALRRQALEFQQLNTYLLADVRDLKLRLEHSSPDASASRAAAELTVEQTRVISGLRAENQSLQERLDQLHAKFEKQMKDVIDAKSPGDKDAVRLGTLAVTDKGASFKPENGGSASLSEGRVVSVDEKDEFVVINLGKKSGVDVGAEFLARQGKSEIARLHVIEVRDTISACNIQYLAPGGRLQINDEVIRS